MESNFISHFCWGIRSWLKSTRGIICPSVVFGRGLQLLSEHLLRGRQKLRSCQHYTSAGPLLPRARARRLDWLINGHYINDNMALIVRDKAALADLWRSRSGFNRRDKCLLKQDFVPTYRWFSHFSAGV